MIGRPSAAASRTAKVVLPAPAHPTTSTRRQPRPLATTAKAGAANASSRRASPRRRIRRVAVPGHRSSGARPDRTPRAGFINLDVDKPVESAPYMDRKHDVLALLKARGSVGLAEAAEHLHVSKQGALRHLEALQARGLVTVSTGDHGRPGRPGHVYRLTAAALEHFPSGHRALAREMVEFMGETEAERFFAERARRLEVEYGA